MKSLFIIGNGFDIAHGLKTSYENFRQYLINEYPDATDDNYDYTIPESSTDGHGEEVYNEDEVISLLLHLISEAEPNGDRWSDIERTIGILDYDPYLDDWGLYDDDENPYHEVYRNEDKASNIAGAILKITKYFSEWIKTIDIGKAKPIESFKKIIDAKNDIFLTFNYTETLEIIYCTRNVCHIHGKIGEELLFGHGNDADYYDYHMDRHIGSESELQKLQHALMKDTKGAIKKNISFFDMIGSSVGKIYSYGCSFSEVDQIYIKTICDKLETRDITWHLNEYGSCKTRNKYKEIISTCGFKGQFDTYTIK